MDNLALEKNAVRERTNLGFTLIETLAVIVMVGILAAIAGPSWARFINQQRVNAGNDAIFRAIQDIQGQAKKEKLSYSISFRTVNTAQGKVPQFAIHLGDTSPTNWRNLGKNLEIKPGQVILGTNLSSTNVAGNSYDSTLERTITFDYKGNLPPINPSSNPGTKGLIITVGIPQSANSTQPINSTRRCVKVTTLLGSLQTASEDGCNAQ